MPYIDKYNRKFFDNEIYCLHPALEGELNYIITSLCHKYLLEKGLSYQNINSVIGVLECVKLELYRMVAAPYENLKHSQNGNISDLDKEN